MTLLLHFYFILFIMYATIAESFKHVCINIKLLCKQTFVYVVTNRFSTVIHDLLVISQQGFILATIILSSLGPYRGGSREFTNLLF